MNADLKKSWMGLRYLFAGMCMLIVFVVLPVQAQAATFTGTIQYGKANAYLERLNASLAAVGQSPLKMDSDLQQAAIQSAADGYKANEVTASNYASNLYKKLKNRRPEMYHSFYVWGSLDLDEYVDVDGSSFTWLQSGIASDYNENGIGKQRLAGIAVIDLDPAYVLPTYENYTYNNTSVVCIAYGFDTTCKAAPTSGSEHRTFSSGSTPKWQEETTAASSNVKVTSVKITGKTSVLTGKKLTLNAAVSPSNASNQAVTWSSSNKKYATVNSKGVVTAKAAGAGKTVTITAKAKDGSGKKASFKVKIKGAVKKITLKGSKTVKAGKRTTIKATVSVGKGGSKKLTWSSSNKNYATVTSKGVVKALKAGKGETVTITAKAKDGSGKKASIKIKIK